MQRTIFVSTVCALLLVWELDCEFDFRGVYFKILLCSMLTSVDAQV
jgi:hypothetical protein